MPDIITTSVAVWECVLCGLTVEKDATGVRTAVIPPKPFAREASLVMTESRGVIAITGDLCDACATSIDDSSIVGDK